MDAVLEAERLGYTSVWAGESYGTDAVTPIAWVLARTNRIKAGTGIMQMSARTPACAAMTAATLQAMSNNRFLLGVGPSGPQVVEGWHGVPYGKPLERTREYIDVVRQILAREKPVEHHGEHYDVPNTGPGTSGLGKPLKSILHGRKDMRIFTASIGAAGIRTSGEVADGVIPVWMNPARMDLILPYVKEGIAKAGGKKRLEDFSIAPFVTCLIGDDLERCRMPPGVIEAQ